jgi:hypothetical protein
VRTVQQRRVKGRDGGGRQGGVEGGPRVAIAPPWAALRISQTPERQQQTHSASLRPSGAQHRRWPSRSNRPHSAHPAAGFGPGQPPPRPPRTLVCIQAAGPPWRASVSLGTRSSTSGWALGGLNTHMNWSTVQWNQRMRKMRSARPWVTSTREALSAKRPALMSRTRWSSKMVILSYTSAPLSPFGKR